MIEVQSKTIKYQRHSFHLSREIYINLPMELIPTKIMDIIEEANNLDQEFRIIAFLPNEVMAEDLSTGVIRYFSTDSVKLSAKQIMRDKKAAQRKMKSEKAQEKAERKRLKALKQLERENKRKLKLGKVKIY